MGGFAPTSEPTSEPTVETTYQDSCTIYTSSSTCTGDEKCVWANDACTDNQETLSGELDFQFSSKSNYMYKCDQQQAGIDGDRISSSNLSLTACRDLCDSNSSCIGFDFHTTLDTTEKCRLYELYYISRVGTTGTSRYYCKMVDLDGESLTNDYWCSEQDETAPNPMETLLVYGGQDECSMQCHARTNCKNYYYVHSAAVSECNLFDNWDYMNMVDTEGGIECEKKISGATAVGSIAAEYRTNVSHKKWQQNISNLGLGAVLLVGCLCIVWKMGQKIYSMNEKSTLLDKNNYEAMTIDL